MNVQFYKTHGVNDFKTQDSGAKVIEKYPTESLLSKENFSCRNKTEISRKTESLGTPKPPNLLTTYKKGQPYENAKFVVKNFKITDMLGIMNNRDKNLVSKAMDIVKIRKEERDSNMCDKREPVDNIVHKTKEIYTIELTTTMIHQEIEKLKKLELDMDKSIRQKEIDFETKNSEARNNLEERKKEMEIELENANTIIGEKAQLLREIKSKTQNLSSLINENKKLGELLSNYKDFKSFIDDLSPDYYKDKSVKLITEEANAKDASSLNTNLKTVSTVQTTNNFGKKASTVNMGEAKSGTGSKELQMSTSHEFTIFFESPDQLIEKINSIEEKNLQMMQANQQDEQNLLDQHNKMIDTKIEKTEKISSLRQLSVSLCQQIEENGDDINRLQIKKANDDKEYSNENFEKIEITLYAIFQTFRHDFHGAHQFSSFMDLKDKKNIIISLSETEKLLYKFSVNLRREAPDNIIKIVT